MQYTTAPTVLSGTVIHADVAARTNGRGEITYAHVRVVCRQDVRGGARWQAVLVTGAGNQALREAEAQRDRLLGHQCQGHGLAVSPLIHHDGDEPELVLHGVQYLRRVDPPPAMGWARLAAVTQGAAA